MTTLRRRVVEDASELSALEHPFPLVRMLIGLLAGANVTSAVVTLLAQG